MVDAVLKGTDAIKGKKESILRGYVQDYIIASLLWLIGPTGPYTNISSPTSYIHTHTHFLSLSSSSCTFCCNSSCILRLSSCSSASIASTLTCRAMLSAWEALYLVSLACRPLSSSWSRILASESKEFCCFSSYVWVLVEYVVVV